MFNKINSFLGRDSTRSAVIEIGGRAPAGARSTNTAQRNDIGTNVIPFVAGAPNLLEMATGSATPRVPTQHKIMTKLEELPVAKRMYGEGAVLRKGESRLAESNKAVLGALLHEDGSATILLTADAAKAAVLGKSFVSDVSKVCNSIRGSYRVTIPLLASVYAHYEHESERQTVTQADSINQKGKATKLGHDTVRQCIELGASDAHMEIRNRDGEMSYTLRMRIDGVMEEISRTDSPQMVKLADMMSASLFQSDHADESSRSESTSSSKITQHALTRIPEVHNVALRYQTILDKNGYDVVLRLLSYDGKNLATAGLHNLGFEKHHEKMLMDAMVASYGLTLIMGPTGAGKTSTIAAALAQDPLRKERKRYTLEDPVEIDQPDVTSSYVQHSANDLESDPWLIGLKGMLRGDPDFIMFGEIRDRSTAVIAQQAALTGHNVWASLHINSMFRTFDRLTSPEIGLDPVVLSADDFLNCFAVQRLVQKLCPDCKIPYKDARNKDLVTPAQEKVLLGYEGMADVEGRPLQTMFVRNQLGNTCPTCKGKGIKGRIGVAEVTQLDFLDPEHNQRLIMERRFGELEIEYWRSRKSAFNEADMGGKTILGHGLLRASRGEICTAALFSYFPRMGMQLQKFQSLKVDRLAK